MKIGCKGRSLSTDVSLQSAADIWYSLERNSEMYSESDFQKDVGDECRVCRVHSVESVRVLVCVMRVWFPCGDG